MNCETALELLSASLDGELTAAQQVELQAHLDQCPGCRAIQTELMGLHTACGEMEALPPAGLKERIMENLPPQRSGKVVYWKRWGAMAAALALVALAAWRLPHYLYEKDITQVAGDASAELGPSAGSEKSQVTREIAIAEDLDSADETPPYVDDEVVNANSYVPPSDPGIEQTAIKDASATGASFKYSWEVTDYGIPMAPANFDLATNGAETGAGAIQPRAASPSSTPSDPVYSVDPGDTDAVPEAVPNPDEVQVAAQSFEPLVEDVRDFSRYCAVITLNSSGFGGDDYPRQLQENGDMWYLLPRSVLEDVPQALGESDPGYSLRLEGDDLTPDALDVLVVIPAAGQ